MNSEVSEYNEDQLTDSIFDSKGSFFPSEFVHPAVKERPQYGVKYAKAIYEAAGNPGRYGIWDDSEYKTLAEVAQGRQSVDNLRKMFGFFRDPNGDAADDGSADLSFMDIQVLNLAPKYINRAVEKIMNLQYELQLEAVDVISVHEKETYEASIKAYYEFRTWVKDIGMDPKQFFPDLDVDVLPEYPDELLYEMLTNPKIQKAVDGELGLQLLHEMNDFHQKMRMAAWEMVVFGGGVTHPYRDENGIPRVEKVNMKYFVGSYVEDENFEGMDYKGFFDFPTINQFRKEAKGHLSDDEIEAIVNKYSNRANNQMYDSPTTEFKNYDGLNYVPVLRFYFLSQDDRVFVKRNNKAGNPTILEQTLNWKPAADNPRFGPDGDSTVIRDSYTSVYGGTWVVDSDLVYNYGRKEMPRSNLVDVTLPIKVFRPNYKDGRTVSFVAQMIEPLMMINTAWNKIKAILAKGWMGIREIDFTQLESVALGKAGRVWKPRDVYKHFLQTDTLIKRSPVNKHDQRYSNSAVDNNPSGLKLADYFTAFTTGIQMLEQMTGTTVAESVDQPDRLAVGVMEQSQFVGDLDMGYLFNGYKYLYKSTSHQLLLYLQEAKRDGVGIQGFVPGLGKNFTVPEHIAYCDFALFLTQAPGAAQWAEFYQELAIGLDKGTITHLDSALIREIKNLKKARQILAQRIKINERKAAQMIAANNQAAMEANQASAQSKFEADAKLEGLKQQNEMERMRVQALIDEHLLVREKQLDAAIQNRSDYMENVRSKQVSTDEIIKQAVRNKPEYEKAANIRITKSEKSEEKK